MIQYILRGNISIIPSFLQVSEDYIVQDIYIKGPQVCFHGCISSPDCNDWASHYYKKIGRISHLMPVEPFIGKSEGDIIELTINDKHLVLTCSQKESIHNDNTFENTLYQISQSFKGIRPSDSFIKPLSKEHQELMIVATNLKYILKIIKTI